MILINKDIVYSTLLQKTTFISFHLDRTFLLYYIHSASNIRRGSDISGFVFTSSRFRDPEIPPPPLYTPNLRTSFRAKSSIPPPIKCVSAYMTLLCQHSYLLVCLFRSSSVNNFIFQYKKPLRTNQVRRCIYFCSLFVWLCFAIFILFLLASKKEK